jgi:hexosaminidase
MPGLSKDTIVDIWVNSADARRVLDKGYKIIHASGDYFYLVSVTFGQVRWRLMYQDCGQGGWIGIEGGSNSWCDPFKSWQRMYS